MKKTKRKMSGILILHYVKLFYRSALFLTALIIYIVNRVRNTGFLFGGFESEPVILILIWIVFAVEMLLRFFPSRFESMGCQKQFARNYKPRNVADAKPQIQSPWRTAAVVGAWFLLNGIIGAVYFVGWIDKGILLLIALAYSVCDIICILFFCPFQTWFMKNRCCATCRIYNWDFAMMFTPLIFVKNPYSWSLVALSLVLLIKWEFLVRKHPERFSECTNTSLSCSECKEKLCHHKTQLHRFWAKNKDIVMFVKDLKNEVVEKVLSKK